MIRHSANTLSVIGEAALRSAETPPVFIDFSLPVAHTESWTATSDDVIEQSIAGLITKERRLCSILHEALEAREQCGAMFPGALVGLEKTFDGHFEALAALYPDCVYPLGRGVDRAFRSVTNFFRTMASKLVSSCSTYPSKLNELYAVASEISIAYVSLQATALSLGDRCAAAVAARHLRHIGQLLLSLHALVPYESVRDLQARGFKASTDDLWEVAGVTALPS